MKVLDGKSTTDVLNGLKMLFVRRGVSAFITSDVSTEFVRNSQELDLLWKGLNKKELHEVALAHNAEWNFGFPYCPQRQGLIERLHRPVKIALQTKFTQIPSLAELTTLICQVEGFCNMKPLGFVRSSSTDSYETITPLELDKGVTHTFLPEYRTKKDYNVTDLVTSKDIAKRRKLLDISLTRAWNNWLKGYIQDQNNIKSSHGIEKSVKQGDVVLLNSVELGYPRGNYVTGIVI